MINIESYWWENKKTLFVKEKLTGNVWKLENVWAKSIQFDGLDTNEIDTAMIGTNKTWQS